MQNRIVSELNETTVHFFLNIELIRMIQIGSQQVQSMMK